MQVQGLALRARVVKAEGLQEISKPRIAGTRRRDQRAKGRLPRRLGEDMPETLAHRAVGIARRIFQEEPHARHAQALFGAQLEEPQRFVAAGHDHQLLLDAARMQ